MILGMTSTIVKTIKYPLIATTFSSKEINRMIKPIHDIVLPKSKIYRNLPYALRYRPKDLVGLSLYNVCLTQGIEKVIMWIEEKNSDSLSGPLLRANYEAALMQLGIEGKKLFSLDFITYGNLLPHL
jgi:hypothetical protein